MTDLAQALAALRRPRILIRAARAGMAEYRRERDLKRILRKARAEAGAHPLGSLIAEESRLEAHRARGEATYSIQQHVAVLTALIAEARLQAVAP